MDHLYRWTILAFLLLGQVLGGSRAMGEIGPEDPPQDDNAMVEYLARGSRAHLDRFPFGRAKMTITTAYAQSIDDALARNWLSDPAPVAAESLWAVDGDTTRYDLIYDPALVEKEKTNVGGRTIGRLMSTSQVRNKRFELWHLVTTGQIFASPLGTHTYEGWNPFQLRIGPPLDTRVASGNVHYEGERKLDGRMLPVLKFWGKVQVDYYWIDPDQGYTPVRVETYFPPEKDFNILSLVEEFAHHSGDRWVPRRSIQVTRNTVKLPFRLTEMKVLELDVDSRPPPELLSLPVRPGAGVMNEITGKHFRVHGGAVSLAWFAEDGSLNSPAGTTTPFGEGIPPEGQVKFPVQGNPRYGWFWLVVALVGFLLAVIAFILYRRRA